jgi:hypothetical protein
MLRFIILPAAIILVTVWWLVLKHSLARLLPFLAIVVVLVYSVRLIGLSPLAFFVSGGGYLWFGMLAWVAAALVWAIFDLPA